MVIIVTGTIAPKKQEHLAITNMDERLLQYRNTLRQLIMSGSKLKIIFCENSNYGIEAFNDLTTLAEDYGVELEVLSFEGNSEAVVNKGKGYGEGEIIQYVFNHSTLIQNEEYMIKLTGRLCVDNIKEIVRHINKQRVYFNVPNLHSTKYYDTRMYAMPVAVYREYFFDAYKSVWDSQNYFIEHAYTEVVSKYGLPVYNFPKYPRITGISGSGGVLYTYTKWKTKIKDLLSLFNIYGRIR